MKRDGFDLYSNLIYLGAMACGLFFIMLYKKSTYHTRGRYKMLWCFLAAAPLSLVLGLRSYHVGFDTYMYTYHMYGRLEALTEREFVFAGLMRLLHSLTQGKHYPVMLLFFSFAAVFLALYAAVLLSGWQNAAVFFTAYCLIFGLCLTDQFRQLLGCSFFLAALAQNQKKKKAACTACICLGFGIHNTLAAALVCYAACCAAVKNTEKKIKIRYAPKYHAVFTFSWKLILFLAAVSAGTILFYKSEAFLQFLIQLVPDSYLRYFTDRLDYQRIGLGFLLDTMIIIPALFLREYARSDSEKAMRLFSFFIPVFRVCGYVSYFLYRLLYYPEIVLLAFYALIMTKYRVPGKWKTGIIFICVLYYAVNYMYLNHHGAFPYQFYFELPELCI